MYFHKLNLNRIPYIKFVKCGKECGPALIQTPNFTKANQMHKFLKSSLPKCALLAPFEFNSLEGRVVESRVKLTQG